MLLCRVKRVVEDLPHGKQAFKPELPTSLDGRWGQADSYLNDRGEVLVYVSMPTDDEIAQIEKQDGAEIIKTLSTNNEDVEFYDGFKEQAPNWKEADGLYKEIKEHLSKGASLDDMKSRMHIRASLLDVDYNFHKNVKEEFIAVRSSAVSDFISVDKHKIMANDVLNVVKTFGFMALTSYAAFKLHPSCLMGLTTLYADPFDGTSTLAGTTTPTGGGTWANGDGSFAKVSGAAGSVGPSGENNVHISDMTARAAMRVSAKNMSTDDWMVGARIPSGANPSYNGYQAYMYTQAASKLYVFSGSTALLGSGAAWTSGTDVIGVDCDSSTNISTYKNGAVDISPVSDSQYATGRASINCYGTHVATHDDFLVEIPPPPLAVYSYVIS